MDYIYGNLSPELAIKNLIAENIKKDVTVTVGNITVTGTLVPAEDQTENQNQSEER